MFKHQPNNSSKKKKKKRHYENPFETPHILLMFIYLYGIFQQKDNSNAAHEK